MATNQGLKGVCVDVAARVGKTKPFGLKGVIFPEAAASAPRLEVVCGQPYRRKGICAPGLQFMPASVEGEPQDEPLPVEEPAEEPVEPEDEDEEEGEEQEAKAAKKASKKAKKK